MEPSSEGNEARRGDETSEPLHSVRQAVHWSGGLKSLRLPDEGGCIQRRG